MTQKRQKRVLFISTGDLSLGRVAEARFNAVCATMRLPWVADLRGLDLDCGAATDDDCKQADWIVALNEAEDRPKLQTRFAVWEARVEYWQVVSGPDSSSQIEREVADLAARLIGGGRPRQVRPLEPAPATKVCPNCKKPEGSCSCKATVLSAKTGIVVRVGRETKGRRGKGVTIVSDVPLNEASLQELAGLLKQRCGTGGTVKDGKIEIQGDQRDRLTTELEKLGYKVKRVGG